MARRKAADKAAAPQPVPPKEPGATETLEPEVVPFARVSPVPPAAPVTALALRDPLELYLAEIRGYELLTPEEERELTVEFARTQDPKIAFRLITSNLRLVVKIAMEYRRAYTQTMDLIQEGNIGLMQAVKHYDPEKGIRLPSYAQMWIRAYILRYILANHRLVKIGTTQAQRRLFYNLKKERERLRSEGFDPTPKLLAARLNESEADVAEMEQRLRVSEVSLDVPAAPGGETSLADVLGDAADSPEDLAVRADTSQRIRAHLDAFAATLNERDRIIWDTRVAADEPRTLQEIGERFQISRERARQLCDRLKDRFRDYLREAMGSETETQALLED